MWHWHTFVTTTGGGLLQNKSKQGGILFFENPPEIFHFYNLLLEISDKTKLNPMMDIPQNCVCQLASQITWKFHGRKQNKDPCNNSMLFFLGHHWKFHFVFNLHWKFHITWYFFDTPGNSIPSTHPHVWIFSDGQPLLVNKKVCVCVCVCVNVFVSVE